MKTFRNNWENYSEIKEKPSEMAVSAVSNALERAVGDRGNKVFELSNHLGNVLATVSDKKLGRVLDSTSVVAAYYEGQVRSVQDYYAFGWNIPSRKFNTGSYRHGFNGKENDSDYGEQFIQDYGFRIYNPSVGRFLSVDPLAPDYPELTPYQFASNSSIAGIDLDGLEFSPSITRNGTRYINAHLAIVNSSGLEREAVENIASNLKTRFEEVYKTTNPKTGTRYRSWFTYRIVDKIEDVNENEYYMELVTWKALNPSFNSPIEGGGTVGSTRLLGAPSTQLAVSSFDEKVTFELVAGETIGEFKEVEEIVQTYEELYYVDYIESGVHEIGHMLGFPHVWNKSQGIYKQLQSIIDLENKAGIDLREGLESSEYIKTLKGNLMNTNEHPIPALKRSRDSKATLLPSQVIQAHNNIYNKKVGNPRPEQDKIATDNFFNMDE